MENPWRGLPQVAPYLLPSDREAVLIENKSLKEFHKIRHNVLPEPYLGNPEAPIILLNLNPGYAEEDIPFYEQAHVHEMWRKNILHEASEYPFWLIDPSLDENVGGTKWWLKKFKEPIQIAGLKNVANRICCIEWFPYHSHKFKQLKENLDSQKYSFYLVEQAIKRNAIIVIMRSKNIWFESIPSLRNYKYKYYLNSAQNVAISRKNCPKGFFMIEEIIQR